MKTYLSRTGYAVSPRWRCCRSPSPSSAQKQTGAVQRRRTPAVQSAGRAPAGARLQRRAGAGAHAARAAAPATDVAGSRRDRRAG